ncbi:carbohydrate ABC transporter substrate-binding protein (CUT1 family) [Lachnotalea glycerini]|uniref:Carbohydrate ABC transporter substrate-binding protein (CUT1 family) n=1 Tax=Lachnotalea glycerini TaxID=1763509 RepID=A0A255I787_9FIRM|nr:ABC transporter substrate-binding protein [Lachnotalea glycerini]PXV95866.1 carbohydrate ABC transporter substrate-binding protein (CUT1 family) [Lachnotalea glycerini]RDY33079.1 extracellular solute-binding protein [Lachnotalea glycerini]
MKKMKKITAAILTISMIAGLSACGTSDGEESSTKDASTDYDKIVYAYATFNNIPESDTLDTVEEEINKITREKIGVEVELMPIAISDYSSKVNLSLQGGDQIDVFESLGDFNTSVSSSMAYDLTDLMDTCAPETKALLGEDLLNACVKDSKLYGIPTYKPYALTPMVIYKQEIADELGIDMTQVKSIYDLTDVLRKVKEAYPNMAPLVPVSQGTSGINLTIGNVDYLTDDYNYPKGILLGDDMTVKDYYSTEEFTNACSLVRTWYNEGLILQDAATTTSTSTELMSADNSFCYVAAYSYPTEDTAASLEPQVGGTSLGAVQIGDAYLDTTSINAVSWMVSSTSKVPEAALKFLNLTFTDKDIVNLLVYGIKDRDYVLNDDGSVSYPEGLDAATVPYTAQLCSGTLGNFFNMYQMGTSNPESLVWEEEQNQTAKKSPAMGFTFDSSLVKTEYTSVTNVIQQYLPGLLCGSIDPETALSEFRGKLAAAGLDKIITEKQKQLDEWLAKK